MDPFMNALQTMTDTEPHPIDVDDDDLDEVSYWPLFAASVRAMLLTVVFQIGTAIWFSVQFGGTAGFRLWYGLPVLVITTPSSEAFLSITFWSSVVTAGILVAYAITAHRDRHRLQVQSGRSFAFLDVCLIGTLPILARLVGVGQVPISAYHLNLAVGGAVGFAAAQWLVWDRHRSREPLGEVLDEVDGVEPSASLAGAV